MATERTGYRELHESKPHETLFRKKGLSGIETKPEWQRPATRVRRRVKRAGAELLILHTDLCLCRPD